jgi:hypothetical protein
MEGKLYLLITAIGAVAVMFTPVPDYKYVDTGKDKTTQKAEQYLEELKKENKEAIDSIQVEIAK